MDGGGITAENRAMHRDRERVLHFFSIHRTQCSPPNHPPTTLGLNINIYINSFPRVKNRDRVKEREKSIIIIHPLLLLLLLPSCHWSMVYAASCPPPSLESDVGAIARSLALSRFAFSSCLWNVITHKTLFCRG